MSYCMVNQNISLCGTLNRHDNFFIGGIVALLYYLLEVETIQYLYP